MSTIGAVKRIGHGIRSSDRRAARMTGIIVKTGLFTALAGLLGAQPASADVYTWVDAKGQLNISNLTPPEGARVTGVVHVAPPPPNPYAEAAREAAHQAEVQALSQRLSQLEGELQDAARRPPPAPAPQLVMMMPPPVQYAAEPAPAPVAAPDCGYGWNGCNPYWASGFAPYTTVYLVAPSLRPRPPFHGRPPHGFVPRPPMKDDASPRPGHASLVRPHG
jgi:hypothetical protein